MLYFLPDSSKVINETCKQLIVGKDEKNKKGIPDKASKNWRETAGR